MERDALIWRQIPVRDASCRKFLSDISSDACQTPVLAVTTTSSMEFCGPLKVNAPLPEQITTSPGDTRSRQPA